MSDQVLSASRVKKMNDFISNEERIYRFKLGAVIASSLSGFIAGAMIASIAWLLFIIVERGGG